MPKKTTAEPSPETAGGSAGPGERIAALRRVGAGKLEEVLSQSDLTQAGVEGLAGSASRLSGPAPGRVSAPLRRCHSVPQRVRALVTRCGELMERAWSPSMARACVGGGRVAVLELMGSLAEYDGRLGSSQAISRSSSGRTSGAGGPS